MLETPEKSTKSINAGFSGNEIDELDSDEQKKNKYIFMRLAEQLFV
ncbi:MAG TPA: hypothetical protein VF354_04905 [Candidatus Methanoperedens sp.]